MIKTPHPIKLIEKTQISPSVMHLLFDCPYPPLDNFVAGQFLTMHIPTDEGKVIRRSYSIANLDNGRGQIEFAASYVPGGHASELFAHLRPGETIDVTGPFGRLLLKDEVVDRYMLVATSTGVTPYRAMLDQLSQKLAQSPELEVHLLQGVKDEQHLLYRQDFEAFAEQERAYFHPCLSRVPAEDASPPIFAGYVQHKLEALLPARENDVYYLCGNPTMVDACYSLLIAQGVVSSNVRREKYLSK